MEVPDDSSAAHVHTALGAVHDEQLAESELAKAREVLAAMQQAGLRVEQLADLMASDRALFEMVIEWDVARVRGSIRGCAAAVTGMQIHLDRLNRQKSRSGPVRRGR